MPQSKYKTCYREIVNLIRRIIHNDLYLHKYKKENDEMLNTRDIEELKGRIQAMTDEELEIVVENIPVDMCLKRINDEINRGKALRKYIDDAVRLSSVGGPGSCSGLDA